MVRVALSEVKDDLSRYLRLAETEDVVITRHGVPAGVLVGIPPAADAWEDALLSAPAFQERVARAREELSADGGLTLEELRRKHGIASNA